jgi:hypothetical protein
MEFCSHIFHKTCLKQFFLDQINLRNIPIKCPEDKCRKEISMFDLKDILSASEI